MDYIEENICANEKLTNEELAKVLGVNPIALSTIFSFITNVGIKEYIRYRKLTLSVQDLLTGESVINVAIKYGYDSATAFSRAFTKFHNIKPSEITSQSTFSNFSKIHFESSLKELNNINYHFEVIDNKKIYGFKKRMIAEEIKDYAPPFWRKIEKEHPILKTINPTFSVIEYPDDFREKGCYYWVGAEEAISSEYIEIKNMKFIVFKIEGNDYTKIPIISKLAYIKYVPSINKEILDTVSLEIYYEDSIEVWMPIETD